MCFVISNYVVGLVVWLYTVSFGKLYQIKGSKHNLGGEIMTFIIQEINYPFCKNTRWDWILNFLMFSVDLFLQQIKSQS